MPHGRQHARAPVAAGNATPVASKRSHTPPPEAGVGRLAPSRRNAIEALSAKLTGITYKG